MHMQSIKLFLHMWPLKPCAYEAFVHMLPMKPFRSETFVYMWPIKHFYIWANEIFMPETSGAMYVVSEASMPMNPLKVHIRLCTV